jgi:ribonuclease VapC
VVLDTSAIIAIELREPGYEALVPKINNASVLMIGAPTVIETAMVLSSRLKRETVAEIMEFLRRHGVTRRWRRFHVHRLDPA